MREATTNGTLERDAASNLWRRTLSQIPSTYGRLVYLSSLRDLNSGGTYEHNGLSLMFGDAEAVAAIVRSHEEAFAEWLNFPLEQQKADLDLYVASLSSNRSAVVEAWLRVAPHRNLVPSSARGSERALFSNDFNLVLEALRREYALAAPDPEA
jgi:hypothetical protein